MSAEVFITKMQQFKRIAAIRAENPFGPFIFTVSYNKVNDKCKFFDTMKTRDLTTYGGYNLPICINPEVANLFAQDGRKILTCEGCSYCETTSN